MAKKQANTKLDEHYEAVMNSMRLGIKFSGNPYKNLTLPEIPTNFYMLLSTIDYPDKAKKNPNGSLMMDPTKEILQTKSDLGQKFFGGKIDFNGIFSFPINNGGVAEAKLESFNKFAERFKHNTALQSLLEGDIDPIGGPLSGKELNAETLQKQDVQQKTNKGGNIIDLIDDYVTASVNYMEKLVRYVSGTNGGKVSDVIKTINELNLAAQSRIDTYLKKNNKFFDDLTHSEEHKDVAAREKALQVMQRLIQLQAIIGDPKTVISPERKEKITKAISEKTKEGIDLTEDDYKYIINTFFGGRQVKELKAELEKGTLKISESNTNLYLDDDLFEDGEMFTTPDTAKKALDSKESPDAINFDDLFAYIKGQIKQVMAQTISNDPTEWNTYKNAEKRMIALKDAASKEIEAKIDLICRTTNGQNSDIGDKFKAILSKHPLRAEGLKNLWKRYADDLDGRIEQRLKAITGNNGPTSIFDTIREFLTVTYPNLIATMLTYKNIFYLIKSYSAKYPPIKINEEETKKQLISIDKLEVLYAIERYESE